MNRLIESIRDQQGMALPLAFIMLVALTVMAMTFLSMAAMEPQISTNLNDSTRARYVADAGIEWAFDLLALAPATGTGSWSALLAGTPVAGSNPPTAWLTPAGGLALAGMPGAFTVQIRNDNIGPGGGYAGDRTLTGYQAGGASAEDPGGQFNDTNGIVIITSAGTVNGATRTIQVVMSRVPLPPFPGAYSMPGSQADLWFDNANFIIDGNDWQYDCTANCNDPNPNNRTYTYSQNSNQLRRKFGIAVQPGIQQNTNPQITYEQRAEYKLTTGTAAEIAAKQSHVIGMNQTNPSQSTTGLNTVAAPTDPSQVLNPAKMQTFLNQLAAFSATQIYQSNLACAQSVGGVPVGIRMIGNADTTQPNLVTIRNNCSGAQQINQQIDLGTKDKPALVYFRGDLDPTSAFAGVRTEGSRIKGAGILIVEDGDFRFNNQFDWDGIVIVTGRYTSSIFESGAQVNVYGATVANETIWNEGGVQGQSGYATFWDGYFASSIANGVGLRNSQQNLDLVQRKLLFRISTWRELSF